jgi:hypothetical protein
MKCAPVKTSLRRGLLGILSLGLLSLLPAGATSLTAGSAVQAADLSKIPAYQRRILSGFASYSLGSEPSENFQKPKNYQPTGSDDCPVNLASNIKVNQNCLNVTDPSLHGRAQANNETGAAQDPFNPNHMIISDNDYRRGDGNCYAAYSLDKGRTWNDTTIPMGFTSGSTLPNGQFSREYWEAGGDTSVAWDTRGNAYLDCQVFNRGVPASQNPDLSSGVYVFRSTQNDGASWNFPGRPVITYQDFTGAGIPGLGTGLEDKPYLTVDNHMSSPFRDRVYVTWTFFNFNTGTAYIFEAYSADYGEHFSNPVLVSATVQYCTNTFGAGLEQGSCNQNQDSVPFTGPDGSLYVVYNNYNNQATSGADNRYQVLIAKSTDGGQSFQLPQKVSDYYDLPECSDYQQGKDAGRQCVPEKDPTTANSFFRANNYPVGVVNPQNPSSVVVTFGSYINKFSQEPGCVPAGFNPATGNPDYLGVKSPGTCNNKILISISNDAGATWSGTATDPRVEPTVNQDPGQAGTDQWWEWTAFDKQGKLAVSYYDRQYGTDELVGNSDVSLSGSGDEVRFVVERVTSSSMPPPTEFGGLFFGDYSGLTAYDNAYPAWMDTRVPALIVCPTSGPPQLCSATDASTGIPFNDEDIFTAALPVPSK